MKKLNKKQRAKLIERSMRLVWDSLESHLYYLYIDTKKEAREMKVRNETTEFHRKTIGEYLEILNTLYKLL